VGRPDLATHPVAIDRTCPLLIPKIRRSPPDTLRDVNLVTAGRGPLSAERELQKFAQNR
jgi:hypothetical protein